MAITPLMLAAQNGHAEIVELLVSHDDLDARDATTGYTCLHLAAIHGHVGVVRVLLRVMSAHQIHAECRKGSTALMLAARHGHVDVVRLFPSEEYTTGRAEKTPLHEAAAAGRVDVVRVMLDHMSRLATDLYECSRV